MSSTLLKHIGSSPIIPAVRKPEDLQAACASDRPVVFLLTGDLFTVGDYTNQAIAAGKKVFLHVDFIGGLGNDTIVMKYIAERVRPAGIISTKQHFVKQAKKCGLAAIQRLFLIDTSALHQGITNVLQSEPDAVEIMPGLIPRVIRELSEHLPIPIIAGGLIKEEEEIRAALEAGASAVSMGNKSLWESGIVRQQARKINTALTRS
ncbi:Glycerol uptake operon antiterminator regulatory protein [Paenibacillus sp. CECT 9249]|uniref:glycerol-3-phosphate responsive antiterminator n=1 Tax=Paenibacillus sp. CECT 9249 TaxID=2845385 RepID=UPI001E2C020C|nr:glycerol-3-phosphate responsive antiterminator [Paenibacillus sp. CECT 9249]CAH0121320.1 Glycerol uptake operon antiterminator regulatory protein [Paenibacillus sp. CECT 9249]